jgi:hypothetical protein
MFRTIDLMEKYTVLILRIKEVSGFINCYKYAVANATLDASWF